MGKKMQQRYGWWIGRDSFHFEQFHDDRKMQVGRWQQAKPYGGKVVACPHPRNGECGMHASERLGDAISYRSTGILCRVLLKGDIVREPSKMAARYRKILWTYNLKNIEENFLRWCLHYTHGLVARKGQTKTYDRLMVLWKLRLRGRLTETERREWAGLIDYASTYSCRVKDGKVRVFWKAVMRTMRNSSLSWIDLRSSVAEIASAVSVAKHIHIETARGHLYSKLEQMVRKEVGHDVASEQAGS